MTIIFRLAGNREYNMPCSNSPYSYDVEEHFSRFGSHAVIRKAQELFRKHHVCFADVPWLGFYLEDEISLKERIPLDDPVVHLGRWPLEQAREFLELAREFVREADYASFVEAHRPLYLATAIRMNQVLRRYDLRRWLDNYFGLRQTAEYGVVVALLSGGGNYGTSVRYPDGSEEITPIIGCAHFDHHGIPIIDDRAWLPTIVHEFCHPYTNPLFEKNPEPFRSAGNKLLARNRSAMRSQAYGSWQAVICETLVRACVVRYLEANHGQAVADKDLKKQSERGFKWVGGLCEELRRYERQRDVYPTFEDFMPEVAAYLNRYVDQSR